MRRVPPNLKALQTVVATMAMGMVLMVGVFVYLRSAGSLNPSGVGSNPDVLTYAMAGAAAVLFAMSFVIPPLVEKQHVRKYAAATESEREPTLMRIMATVGIIRGTFLEGMGLIGGVAYLLTGAWWFLAAPLVAVGGMLISIPTERSRAALAERLQRRVSVDAAFGHRG